MPDAHPPRSRRAPRRRTATVILSALLVFVAGLTTAGPAGATIPSQPGSTATTVLGPEDEDLRTECATRPEAKTRKGWIKNRFEACVHQPVYLKLIDDKKRLRGELWFDLWILGFTYDGSRRVDYTSSIENIKAKAVAGENPATWKIDQNFSHSINASASGPNPRMTKPAVTSRSETIAQWKAKPFWQLNYTSPDTGKLDAANTQIVSGMVSLEMRVSSPTAVPWSDPVMAYSSVRFDYAGPTAGKFKGTVFTEARVELVMSLKDPAVNESARHILDAQTLPERTFPSFPGKSVPGGSTPLHRLIDKTAQDKNRDAAIATCKDVWGDYSGTKLQCDEYPFASTKEGAAAPGKRFSARLIDGGDNETGGRRLNEMYTLNRILNGDAFYVKITP
ncbi:NucA/NucB deoxyribonuclease domain-containing protein [Streptomyces sp. NBC_01233]|uniref:NucA/NucB deoxyribonuclease domain-containing protein n=1 Tax=Streptomyces sp. NBC_01233 TaxID=2903787 RepID=UPI002E12B214|nr:NucA/NucB deoxyribonuclease domain-containing protein [Streptomyces sp. NBC_01233]